MKLKRFSKLYQLLGLVARSKSRILMANKIVELSVLAIETLRPVLLKQLNN